MRKATKYVTKRFHSTNSKWHQEILTLGLSPYKSIFIPYIHTIQQFKIKIQPHRITDDEVGENGEGVSTIT